MYGKGWCATYYTSQSTYTNSSTTSLHIGIVYSHDDRDTQNRIYMYMYRPAGTRWAGWARAPLDIDKMNAIFKTITINNYRT